MTAVEAETYNWIKTWGLQPAASNTEFGSTVNPMSFTIAANDGDNGANGLMSVKKQVKSTVSGSTTSLWWGYTTQLNMKTDPTSTNVIVQWLTT